MVEAKPCLAFPHYAVTIDTCRLKERECADDVGRNESGGAVDRAIDVTFRCEMHDTVHLFAEHDIEHCFLIADIEFVEAIARITGDLGQGRRARSIGKLVNIDDPDAMVADKMSANRRANETVAPRHQYFHQFPSSSYRNPLSIIANPGAARSLSDRTSVPPLSGQSIPISGSSNRIFRSWGAE